MWNVSLWIGLLAGIPLMAQNSDALIEAGVHALQQARNAEAIAAFQRAAELEPASARPHNYLAIAWQGPYIPGTDSDENQRYGKQATKELLRASELDPQNWESLVQLGNMASWEGRSDEAREWFEKALKVRPRDADTWYARGVVSWRQWSRDRKPDVGAVVVQGMNDLNRALELDPGHFDAMKYLAMFLEERARVFGNEEARRADVAAAEKLLRRSKELKDEAIKNRTFQKPDKTDRDIVIRMWADMAVHPAPPPDPPPPPPPVGSRQELMNPPIISFDPVDKK